MDVHLEILQGRLKQGKNEAGVNRFKIRLSRFVIGSDVSCHMVCKSRTISNRHCLILIENDIVLVRDLDGKAGTFINDVPVDGTQLIGDGDKLRIGRLEFKLLVTVSPPQSPPPETTAPTTPDVSDQHSFETVVGSETVDTLVTDLLQEEDEVARAARYADPTARYFRADQIPPDEAVEVEPEQPPAKKRPAKRSVGKLPTPLPIKTNDTVSAAEQALHEIFQPSKGPGKS
ncbi:MAG: FHA domain-containing protein [Pirellulaceae bacterium]|jgi:predicted component of type VI protein secretion system|nr:hypothetical protein [Planctomycetaceae bacterium]MDP6467915.1 FHA domain-containing protein [Pirellulaceae bacterium]